MVIVVGDRSQSDERNEKMQRNFSLLPNFVTLDLLSMILVRRKLLTGTRHGRGGGGLG